MIPIEIIIGDDKPVKCRSPYILKVGELLAWDLDNQVIKVDHVIWCLSAVPQIIYQRVWCKIVEDVGESDGLD